MDVSTSKQNTGINLLFEKVSQNISEGIIIINESGQLLFTNRKFEDLVGYTHLEIESNSINVLLPETDKIADESKLLPILRRRIGKGSEIKLQAKNGQEVTPYATFAEIFNGISCLILRDLSGQKEQEKMLVDEVIKRSSLEEKQFIANENLKSAVHIHASTLPAAEAFDLTKNHFVIYKNKESISGDLYSVSTEGAQINIVLIDTNINGVSGGYLSLLIKSYIESIIAEEFSSEPGEILGKLNSRLLEGTLLGKGGKLKSKIQVTFCQVDTSFWTVKYASANGPLLVLGNGFYQEVIGNKTALPDPEVNEFAQREFALKPNENLYLLTDGFYKQLNEQGEEYSRPRLIETLLAHQEEPLSIQVQTLETELSDWRGNAEQTDDITIIGLNL